jgi:radical SAM/Cys-rich protein
MGASRSNRGQNGQVDSPATTSADFDFAAELGRRGLPALRRVAPRTLQINVGMLCNQACHHCHVDAGPKRVEQMDRATAERVVSLLAQSPGIETFDLTGGAPELNENFSFLVEGARAMGRRVIVRCNLTVIFESGMEWLPGFYRENRVELVCSLPCYSRENVERQRGAGVFGKSIAALGLLNRLGYGHNGSRLRLDLVYNPVGAFLPPRQEELEARYREELGSAFGVSFNRLLTITNMPINRFARELRASGMEREYMSLLVNHFNPATVERLMCRELVSVGYDGVLYDCDFNQMAAMPIRRAGGERSLTVFDCDDLGTLYGRAVATAAHCFGCTAGAGSSCSGALG